MSDLDPRIRRGTERLLARREADHLGWKVGFGAPAARARLGLDRPLVGHLTTRRLLAPGAAVDVGRWTRPVLEAEVAVHLAADVAGAASRAEALAAVGGWSVAIELADLDSPPDDVEEIVAGNIYHRQVLLGPAVSSLDDPAATAFAVTRDGVDVASTSTPAELTGDLGDVLASVAGTLAAVGESLRAGDVVITGSVVPPIDVEPGSWLVAASGLGQVGVRLG